MAEDDTQRYHCTYCGCDITLRLKCAVCTDLDLCLQCFAAGASSGSHKSDHPYQLIDEGSFPLLIDDWGAIEEVLLLDAVEQDGFGNWEDIAAHVVTKTARESRDHYSDIYVTGIIGEGLGPHGQHSKTLDSSARDVPPSPPSFMPIKLEHSEQQELGYMPLRDDFEREYDNDAEQTISFIPMGHDDDEVETALKLAHVDIYNRRLAEREKRKRIARQHGLVGGKQRINAYKRKFGKEEREFRTKFRSLARLMEPDDYEKFITSMKREKQLKQRIRNLMICRKNGITKSEDCTEFDLLRMEQDPQIKKESSLEPGEDNSSGILDLDQEVVLSPALTLLSQQERKLCNSLSLKPLEYINIKADVLKVTSLRRCGHIVKHKLSKSLSSEVKQKLMKFFTRVGWVS